MSLNRAEMGGLPHTPGRRRCVRWIPCIVFLVLLMQLTFLIHIDFLNASSLQSWATGWNISFSSPRLNTHPTPLDNLDRVSRKTKTTTTTTRGQQRSSGSCEQWLEEKDKVVYSRDFSKQPILVSHGDNKVWSTCAIGCVFKNSMPFDDAIKADASFGLRGGPETASIHRSMESSSYYPENDLATARGRGYTVVMTTSLSSDVPVGYFSWAEYDLMAPMKMKTEKALAAAFISNCGAHNFRLDALIKLQEHGVTVDSYGACHRNREGGGMVNKVEALGHYKFSLAFENSNEDDYVTEKFWQSLVAGAVPVVVGAPNIQDFAPASKSILHIKSLDDVGLVAKEIKHLASNYVAYNDTLRWKFEGPSDAFKALIDMSVVHSSCRLCIHLGTKIRLEEEKLKNVSQNRPCKCTQGSGVIYHLYVRERGRFEMESVFLRSSNLTIEGLHHAIISKFEFLNYVPIFKSGRPKVIQGDDNLRIYRAYPVGMTQREALYRWDFHSDQDVKNFVEANLCGKLEVIFV